MHRLEITGATPEDLFMNAVKMLSVLLRGGAQTAPVEPLPSSDNGSSEETQHGGSTPSEGAKAAPLESAHTVVGKVRRNAKAKMAKGELNDDISDVGRDAKTIEHDPKEVGGKPVELTLDGDIRPRLRAIQKAHTERGHDMKTTVAYIMKLYGPFGITKGDQLKPEQFAKFMEASDGFLSGEA